MRYSVTIACFFLLQSAFAYRAVSYEVFDGDTINIIDEYGRKQGHWILFGRSRSSTGFAPEEKVEEGAYDSNLKDGPWLTYYPGEVLKSEINYERNRPYGDYILYWENGNKQEAGRWERRRNTGEMKRWHQNGSLAQAFMFDQTGKAQRRTTVLP